MKLHIKIMIAFTIAVAFAHNHFEKDMREREGKWSKAQKENDALKSFSQKRDKLQKELAKLEAEIDECFLLALEEKE